MQKRTLPARLLAQIMITAVFMLSGILSMALPPVTVSAQAQQPARCAFTGQSGVFDCPASISPQPNTCYVVTQAETPGQRDTAREVPCDVAPFVDREAYEVEAQCTGATLNPNNCRIMYYIQWFINLLAALVGITVILMLVVGGIQYTTSAANPQRVAAARQRIINAILALLMFIFMYSFLQWLVPGGVF